MGKLTTRVVVVGGGPVGMAVSLYLARENIPVLLIDAGATENKICGEGLLPSAWRILQDLDIAPMIGQLAPIKGLRYRMADDRGQARTLTASLQGAAFGVKRPQLFQAFRKALANSDVQVWNSSRLREVRVDSLGVDLRVERSGNLETIRAGHLVGADGLHSLVRRQCGLQSDIKNRYMRWGTRCYFRSSEQRTHVEVTLGEGIESYLTPLGDDLHGLAFLWSPNLLQTKRVRGEPIFRQLLRRLPQSMLDELPPVLGDYEGGERAVGPLQQGVRSPLHESGRVSLVGDAAGYFDALTGEGLCLGLRQARALSSCLLTDSLHRYPAEYRHIKARHKLVVGGLLWLIHQPRLRERVFGALACSPEMFQIVIRFAVEEGSPREFFSPALAQFLLSLFGLRQG